MSKLTRLSLYYKQLVNMQNLLYFFLFSILINYTSISFVHSKESQRLSIEEYLEVYFKKQESTQISQHQYESLKAQEKGLSGWQSSLTLTPKNERKFSDTPTSAFQFSTSLEQKTPLSTTFFVSFDHRNDIQNTPSQYKTNVLKIGLNQPLWRDFAGNLRRAQKKSLSHQANALHWQHQQNTLDVCLNAISFFTTFFSEQEKVKSYKSILGTSEEVFKKTKGAYHKKMIQKTNLIAAETDYLSTKELYLSSLNRLKKQKKKLHLETELQADEFNNPSTFFNKISPLPHHETPIHNSFQLKASLEDIQRAYSQLDYSKQNSMPQLNLIASAGKNTHKQFLSSIDTSEKIYEIGIQFQLPLWNPSSHSEISSALYQLKIAELNHQNKLKSLETETYSQQLDFGFSEEQLSRSQQKNKLLKEQALIALRELNSGKIGFQEYLLIRDRHLSEEMNALDIQVRHWENLLKTYHSSGTLPKPCLKLNNGDHS